LTFKYANNTVKGFQSKSNQIISKHNRLKIELNVALNGDFTNCKPKFKLYYTI
jgi:hypothetical protein